jgi:hypothetical protein
VSELLTVEELREHVQTALDDEALQRIIDGNDAAITNACGTLVLGDYETPDVVIETNTLAVKTNTLWLKRKPASIESVTEIDTGSDGSDTDLVVEDDYWLDGKIVYRRGGWWGRRVQIEYIPMNDVQERRLLLVQLCQLTINVEPGMSFAGAATWQETYKNFETEKQSLIWAYCPPHPFA